jgi:hypothetical protein
MEKKRETAAEWQSRNNLLKNTEDYLISLGDDLPEEFYEQEGSRFISHKPLGE